LRGRGGEEAGKRKARPVSPPATENGPFFLLPLPGRDIPSTAAKETAQSVGLAVSHGGCPVNQEAGVGSRLLGSILTRLFGSTSGGASSLVTKASAIAAIPGMSSAAAAKATAAPASGGELAITLNGESRRD
jgi:hypothetical protein